MTPEDLSRCLDAIPNIGAEISGEGTRARRLRFLADAVGLGSDEDVLRESQRFRSVCVRAGRLARDMATCQDRREMVDGMIGGCEAAVRSTGLDARRAKRRAGMIERGLNLSLHVGPG